MKEIDLSKFKMRNRKKRSHEEAPEQELVNFQNEVDK